ncbi:alpha-galactosidase [Flavisolibacter ginsenosidimutans]|uniref:Alpha-galactosidase n=1 Tax=Flavisolibacter ginsenosidimutans TaxID=661481 RepID=A0A5B8UIT5_9BACT|nr:alpha-galactosidase [Flavisolibacter ginsenosidimutans]QEC56296.1 alpha-galactosidase [Flavisolibacter ginsenosidimutans]
MKRIAIVLWALMLFSMNASSQIDSVMNASGKLLGWNILTQSSVYQLMLNDRGEVVPVFYGPKAHVERMLPQDRSRGNGPFQLNEVTVRGKYADKIPLVEVMFADGTRDCELVFEKAEVITVESRKTLRITQKDKYYPFVVVSYFRPLPEYDILEKWTEVKNTGKKEAIQIENLLSSSILLQPARYFLTHHGGRWLNEFQLQKTELTTGTKTMQARDFSSFENSPWFAVSNQQEADAPNASVWFGQVHYSGNWRIDLESTVSGHLQIAGGINFWDTQWKLEAGQSFTTPKMTFGFTQKGTDEAARLSAAYIRKEILRPSLRDKIRPVIYNSWYATGFNVNEEGQLKLAREAKDLGVELFVIDDGWFAGRKDDHAGLGDWFTDPDKFPNGLNPLIQKINDMGMQFGIWVEPEMVNPNSQLYKKHPDWVLYFPNRTKTEWRNQLTLNLAREDVYQYLLQSMTFLLKNHNIKFIKWDRNRGLTEPGWPSASPSMQREVRLRYMNNLYRLVDELEKRFPDVLFESCSSGGGRPDLGMLSRMDQTWTSDNTNPLDRLFIQYGYLSAFPANTMVCWTTGYDRSSINLPQEFIFYVAMQGVLGVGDNILQWNDKQKEIARTKIAEYKSIRNMVQQGNLYRLKSPFEGNKIALQYVSLNASEAVVLCYNLGKLMEGATDESRSNKQLLLQGLDPKALYTLDDKNKTTLSGEYLMTIGILWPVSTAYRSAVIKLKKQ